MVKAGEQYFVKDGDRLWFLASDVYGTPYKYPLIVDANPQINGRGLAPDGSPLIFEGDVLWIPSEEADEGDLVIPSFADQQADDFSVEIEGERIAVVSGSFFQTMDTGSDELKFTVDYDSLSDAVRLNLRPFQYAKCRLYIKGELRLTGAVYKNSHSVSSSGGRVVTYTAYSNTIDLVDSVVNPPYEMNSIKLVNLAKKRCADIGITAVFYSGGDEFFKRVRSRSGEKRFSELSKLARQRGLLVSNTASGNILFHRANDVETPVALIEEGGSRASDFSAEYDGRKRYSQYRIVGEGIDGEPVTKTVVDPFVSRARYFYRKESGSDNGNNRKSAEWERSKAVADALSMQIPVSDWFDDLGGVWRCNTYITVKSETLAINTPVNLLVRRVLFNWSSTGVNAVLNVVPKEVFSGDEIPDIWG